MRILHLVLLGVCFYSSDLMAWQREAQNRCKELQKRCEKEGSGCRDRCKVEERDCTSPNEVCRKKANDCREECRKQKEACREKFACSQKEIDEKDEASFKEALTHHARKEFDKFSAEKKKLAMDYADNNHMMPDDAVYKVAGKKPKR